MHNYQLPKELAFKREWIFDPPPELYSQFESHDLAKLAVIQLRVQQAAIKIQAEAIEEAINVYSNYMK